MLLCRGFRLLLDYLRLILHNETTREISYSVSSQSPTRDQGFFKRMNNFWCTPPYSIRINVSYQRILRPRNDQTSDADKPQRLAPYTLNSKTLPSTSFTLGNSASLVGRYRICVSNALRNFHLSKQVQIPPTGKAGRSHNGEKKFVGGFPRSRL